MPAFGSQSRQRLATCHGDLQRLFYEVVKHFDCHVLEGHRSLERQQELYAQGRTTEGNIVTHKDGVAKRSKHQTSPSVAVDVVPWYKTSPHIRWDDEERFYYFAGFVMATALSMGIAIRAGCDWDRDTEVSDERFVDLPHFELIP